MSILPSGPCGCRASSRSISPSSTGSRITACGTASYAGLVAKYWFERVARLPAEVDIASEFRYREAPLPKGGLAIVISQSGETADTLAALRYCKAQGQHTLAIVNVPKSTIAREAEAVHPHLCRVRDRRRLDQGLHLPADGACLPRDRRGPGARRDHGEEERELVGALIEAPRHMAEILKQEKHIAEIAREIAHARDVLYLGRGINYPIALEGALKLKEISYIHAEGYAAGELKHGPIALIDENVPVIVIAPRDDLYDKTVSNMEEVAARGGKIVLLTDGDAAAEPRSECLHAHPGTAGASASSARFSMRCRSSSSPITRRCSWAPMSISRATSPNRSPSNRRHDGFSPFSEA